TSTSIAADTSRTIDLTLGPVAQPASTKAHSSAKSLIRFIAESSEIVFPVAQAGKTISEDSAMNLMRLFALLCAFVLAVLLGLAAISYFLRRVVRPLGDFAAYFDAIAKGDLTQRIHVLTSNEIGDLLFQDGRVEHVLDQCGFA
ncbi:hypothetical protein QWA_17670, partial [Alcaligenes faecalis subsp. faecalis NCIB 8687]